MNSKYSNKYISLSLKYFSLILISLSVSAMALYSQNKSAEIESIANDINKDNQIGIISAEIAKKFLDKPYVGGTLDANYRGGKNKETLIYHFDKYDCVTLCETSLAMARAIKSGSINQARFENELTKIRYRNGIITDYASRLHYTSEWIMDNQARGILKDITADLGGKKFVNYVFFMTKFATSYAALNNDNALIAKILVNEIRINENRRYYIPKTELANVANKIQTGDLIAIATNKNGLDYSHIGMAYRTDDNKLHILHASSKLKKVIIDDELINYINSNKTTIGISVLRPLWNNATGENNK